MNLQKLLNMQKELDKTILDNAGIKEYPLDNITLSLLVELGELCNEWKQFKHWKKHKEIDRGKLKEEFADCLSFALSLENELYQIDLDDIKNIFEQAEENTYKNDYIISQIPYMFINVAKNEDVLLNIIAIGVVLGISEEEMEAAYLYKNKVNYERQNNGY